MQSKTKNKDSKKKDSKKEYFWIGSKIIGKNEDKEIEYYVPIKLYKKTIYYWIYDDKKKQKSGVWKYSLLDIEEMKISINGNKMIFIELHINDKALAQLYKLSLISCEDISIYSQK